MFLTGDTRTLGGPQILEDLPAPGEDVLAASFEEDLLRNPTSSAQRFEELQRAEGDPFITPFGARLVVPDPEQLSPMVSAEEARERAGSLRLDIPDEGIREDHLNMLIESRREEAIRQSILSRRHTGFFGEAALLGQSVIASALDPINIGAAFVPVIREARFAAWAQRFGVVRARAGRGAIEGVAGAALVEPIVLAAATAEQSDYGAWDSLLNIALGGALGGGLHVTGGAALDRIRRARGEPTLAQRLDQDGDIFDDISRRIDEIGFPTREAAMRVAVGQLAIGQSVEVTPLLRTTAAFREVLTPPNLRRDLLSETALGRLGAVALSDQDIVEARVPIVGSRGTPTIYRSRAAAERAGQQLRDVGLVEAVETADGRFILTRSDEIRMVRDGDGGLLTFATEAEARAAARGARFRGQRGRLEPVPVSADERARFALAIDADQETLRAIRSAPGQTEFRTTRQQFPVAGERVDLPEAPSTLGERLASGRSRLVSEDAPGAAVRGRLPLAAEATNRAPDDVVIERLMRPERFDITGESAVDGQRLADEASGAADDTAAITEELNEAMVELENLRARGLLTAEDEARIAAAAEVADDIRRRAASYRAAAHCLAA